MVNINSTKEHGYSRTLLIICVYVFVLYISSIFSNNVRSFKIYFEIQLNTKRANKVTKFDKIYKF